MASTKSMTGRLASRVEFDLVGISPLSFGRAFQSERETGEDFEVYERRVWRERCHTTKAGEIYIPPMMLKKCLESVASYLSESVPGKGMAKFTKHFKSGILVTDPILLGAEIATVASERLYVAADGKSGSGRRVWRIFPVLQEWSGHAVVHILDPILQGHWAKIEEYAIHAGKFIGLGRFAPRRGGFYGRFEVKNFQEFP